MITTEQFQDRKEWYLNDKLHREDGPAIEWNDGSKDWYLNGTLHRENGPASESSNGTKEWFARGKRHREDGPAHEWSDGTKEWFLHGKLHRIGGPAVEWISGIKEWYINGRRHRIDGPAIECYMNGRRYRPAIEWIGGNTSWFFDDTRLSPQEIKTYQISRLRDLTLALSPLELPPYVIFWILEWSENAYIADLDQRSVIKIIEGIRNSRQNLKNIFI